MIDERLNHPEDRFEDEEVVDGLPVSDGANDLDSFVRPGEIGGVEVYNSAIGVPVQYGANSCGAVLIWTKR